MRGFEGQSSLPGTTGFLLQPPQHQELPAPVVRLGVAPIPAQSSFETSQGLPVTLHNPGSILRTEFKVYQPRTHLLHIAASQSCMPTGLAGLQA